METTSDRTRPRRPAPPYQQRIDALRDQTIVRRAGYREDTPDDLAHDREEGADEGYRHDDDQEFDEDTDFHSGLGY
ncbi:MAG: hypothetical protein ACRDSI_12685 [Pseudonocardiaceae bacterium]